MRRLARRVRRVAHLCAAWARYLREERRAWPDLWDWVRTTFGGKGLLESGQPWITYRAQRWVKDHLTRDMSVFEWGSGGSTRFFLDAGVREVVSIEHDGEWHRRVERALDGRPGLTLRHLPSEPESSFGKEVLDGLHGGYRSTHPGFRGQVFVSYARSILAPPAGGFDVVLVDGRARATCAELARDRVRPGGWLVFDNADDPEYAPALARLRERGWRELAFDGPAPSCLWPAFWRTSVFIPPAQAPEPDRFRPAAS